MLAKKSQDFAYSHLLFLSAVAMPVKALLV